MKYNLSSEETYTLVTQVENKKLDSFIDFLNLLLYISKYEKAIKRQYLFFSMHFHFKQLHFEFPGNAGD